jgi:predicted DNA-binding transcriptional regulator YafY
MADKRSRRQLAIVHLLRSREWVSSASLAARFSVSQRTIYRDIDELIASGVPIEAVPGREGGYRLASDQPLDPLTLDSGDALKLYVLGVLGQQSAAAGEFPPASAPETSAYTREALRRLTQRIYFDTVDWYWKDEGSGHLPTLRHALMTGAAVSLAIRVKDQRERATAIVKPYGIVWKAGEWHLVGAPVGEGPTRYRLNLVDHLSLTDLKFTYPDDFRLRDWWAEAMESYGKGDTRVVLRIAPAASAELLRLTLKSNSEVHRQPDGGLTMVLFVDRWQWLIPLLTSYGEDVQVEEPADLHAAMVRHLRRALAAYDPRPDAADPERDPGPAPGFRNDDSRLRSTRGRSPQEVTRA